MVTKRRSTSQTTQNRPKPNQPWAAEPKRRSRSLARSLTRRVFVRVSGRAQHEGCRGPPDRRLNRTAPSSEGPTAPGQAMSKVSKRQCPYQRVKRQRENVNAKCENAERPRRTSQEYVVE